MPRRLLIFPLAAALVSSSAVAANAMIPIDSGGPMVSDADVVVPKVPKSHQGNGIEHVEVWDRVANCESSNAWSIDTGNGFYGGLQFTEDTWLAEGGGQFASYANEATKVEQITVAERTLNDQGPNAWPVCSRVAGLTSAD